MSNTSKALEIIEGKGPVLEIAGATYQMRRLGIADVFKIANLIRDIYHKGAEELIFVAANNEVENSFSLVLALGFTHAEEKIMRLFAYLLDVSDEDIRNAEKFPMVSLIHIGQALAAHPDLVSFFGAMRTTGVGITDMFGISEKTQNG